MQTHIFELDKRNPTLAVKAKVEEVGGRMSAPLWRNGTKVAIEIITPDMAAMVEVVRFLDRNERN